MVNQTTTDVTPVRWVCNDWGHCWWRPGPRWGWGPSEPYWRRWLISLADVHSFDPSDADAGYRPGRNVCQA